MPLLQPDEKLLLLAQKYLDGTISIEEKEVFEKWYNSFDDTFHEINSVEGEEAMEARFQKLIFLSAGIKPKQGSLKIFPYYRVAAAVVFVAFLSVAVYFTVGKRLASKSFTAQKIKNDVTPGSSKATLTLGNGSQIILDDVETGKFASEGNATINKASVGKIVYGTDDADTSSEVVFNTVSTPRGGKFQVTLPDGTNVWLNAASSIKYPTAFKGNERQVEITGEAYFEVAHNAAKPFKVFSNGQVVEVLGTHFNINAYYDEIAIKTTLLEGSVKIMERNNMQLLSPGQQAQVDAKGALKLVKDADIEEATAWKNDKFIFTGNTIQSVMRQLQKWYDIEIEYHGVVTKEEFVGVISRNVNLSQVLNLLKKTQSIDFEINGNKVIIK